MAEPTTTAGAPAALTLAALLSMIPGLDAATILGSFSGAVVFVMASDDLSTVKKILFFLPSFLGGLITAGFAANVLSSILPSALAVSHGVGALVASALVVKTLLWLLARDPAKIFEALRGVKQQ